MNQLNVKMTYMIKYLRVDKWELGGTHYVRENIDTLEEVKTRLRSIHSDIRVAKKSIKIYKRG
jgi:hypothetical protein